MNSLLKLAAIGTVADLVPLTTLENRAIVSIGLLELNRGPHAPGLHALITAAGLRCGEIRETDLGFRIGPRINAAGRMSDASLVIRLLTTRDRQEALQLASKLERFNQERRRVQEQLVDTAMTQGKDVFWLISPEEAARQILAAARNRVNTRYVPLRWAAVMTVIRAIQSAIFRHMNFYPTVTLALAGAPDHGGSYQRCQNPLTEMAASLESAPLIILTTRRIIPIP